jgi:hypothetical protein
MYNHILLNTLNINDNDDTNTIMEKIRNLGLVCKSNKELTRLVVKYPIDKRRSNDELIRKSRGIIIDVPKKQVICHSLEGSVSLQHFLENVSWNDTVIEEAYDGTMFNVYYDNDIDAWKVSTKYSLTPETTYYRSNKSFIELFNEIVPFNQLASKLDKDYNYVFLMCHKDHRNVTPFTNSIVYHLETTNVKTGEKIYLDIGLPRCDIVQLYNTVCKFPKQLENINELHDLVNKCEWNVPGYMLFSKDRKWRCKLENPNFQVVQKLLEGQSDFRFVAMNYITRKISTEQWSNYIKYYPSLNNDLTVIQNEVQEFVKDVYQWYVDIHCFKKELTIPKWVKSPMYYVHQLFISKKKENVKGYRINNMEVNECLINKLDTPLYYQLIRDRHIEKNKNNSNNDDTMN